MYLDKPSKEDPTIKKKPKKLKDFFDFKNNQRNQVGLIFFVAFVASTLIIYQFEERFDTQKWKTQPSFRHQMVDDILDRNLFINVDKNDILDQLGEPNPTHSELTDRFVYFIGEKASFTNDGPLQLVLIFENNKVTEVVIEPKEK